MIGLGVDIVDVERFRASIARTPGLTSRLFTDEERRYAASHRDPVPVLAARFAAKEAAMKALGTGLGSFAFRDVEVVRSESQAPFLALAGRAAQLADQRGVQEWHLSLTHSRLVAEAVVVAL